MKNGTTEKPSLAEIVSLENLTVRDAGKGKKFVNFPSGRPINSKNARFMLICGVKTYVSSTLENLIITAYKDGSISLNKYGYDICPKCSGNGRITGYTHIENGLCFKCKGNGII